MIVALNNILFRVNHLQYVDTVYFDSTVETIFLSQLIDIS